MGQIATITPAQYELLNMLSCLTHEEDIADLKSVIVQFLNSRLQKEIDRLWDNGDLTDEKVAQWSHEHMRTPYRPIPWTDISYSIPTPFPPVEIKRLHEFYEELCTFDEP